MSHSFEGYFFLVENSNISHIFLEEDDACTLPELTLNIQRILKIKNLVLIGKGTFFHAVQYVLKSFRFLETFDSVQAINMAEFELSDLPLENPGVILITETASSYDLFEIVYFSLIY